MTTVTATLRYRPSCPETIEQVGLPMGLLIDLIVRKIRLDGESTLAALSEDLKLPHKVVEQIFNELRAQRLLEVKGLDGDDDFRMTLTAAGRALANERTAICQYTGPAPVSLEQYAMAVVSQAARLKLNRPALRQAFSDLVVGEDLIEKLGPALVAQSSLFIYGPSGTGKTSVAERLLRVFKDAVVVPYAVEVDGQIIILYDPATHKPVDGFDSSGMDPRWVVCHRPCITVGGELTLNMLDLQYDDASGVYGAAVQMKANNGILVVDDFGRQLMTPAQLLNRWIIPLDRRIDFLKLRYGTKFTIPFELMVVFSTNLDPSQLMDKAFFRRIQNKIYLGAVTDEAFDEIFRRVAAGMHLECEPGIAAYARELCSHTGEDLRACYPRDLCSISASILSFEERPRVMTRDDLRLAFELYFATGGQAPGIVVRDFGPQPAHS